MEANNAAAMREALVALTDKVIDYLQKGLIQLPLPLEEATAKARAALSAPPRNCDVGTAEEQAKRLNEWCNGRHCVNCQFKGGWPDECKLRWAQMPYEEGGAK